MQKLENSQYKSALGTFFFKGLKPFAIFINVKRILELREDLADTITHETIHDVLFREVSSEVSCKFDNIEV